MAIDREKVLAAAQKYVEKKKYDRAVVEYQKVIQEDPNDARTLLKVGDLQSKMEAYADAVGTYERVGKFYASQGFALKAIAVYKQIREIIAKHVPQLEDKYAHITPKLAELYQQLGLTSDALAALDEVATRLQRQNRDGEAIQVFRKIVDLDPTNPLPHLRLAEALSRVKDLDGAVNEFGTAAAQLAKLGRRDDALKVLDRSLHHKADPVHARLAAELFLARNGPNDGMQALAKLQVCFQANPRDFDTLALLAKAFNQIGQAAKAIEVHKEMARIARDTGKTDVYRDLVAKLQKLAPNDEGVKRLAASPMAHGGAMYASSAPPAAMQSSAPPPAATSRDAAAEEIDDYEDVGDSDISDVEPEEEPLELSRRSRHPNDDGDVVVESSIEVVEEVGEQQVPAHVKEQVARILRDAAGFRRSRLYAKAIETLQIGLEMTPRSIEVHEALRDTLLDAGQTEDVVQVMLDLAGLQIDGLDGDAAAQTLQDLMQLDPHNARATEMLRELGYELVDDNAGASASQSAQLPPMRPEHQSVSSYDPEAPLPSYDLEEIGPEDVALRSYSEPSMRVAQPAAPAQPRSPSIDDIDDPFGDAPLPAYPLEGPPESAAAFELVQPPLDATDAYASQPDVEEREPGGPGTPDIEQALEEAEFFTSRGLFDDARTILQEQLARIPNHPLLLERLAEIDAHEGVVQNGSGTRMSPSAAEAEAEDRSFDIAESLGGLDGDRASGVGPGAAFGGPQEQVDVEEVFAKFKEGVAKQIGVDDAQSHYDLGVAYKEMGLVDDAVREFETAARDPKRACICHSMIGMIQLERGNLNEAIDAFMRGLQAQERTKDQEAALSYEIAAAYEVKKMQKQALDYFQRAARAVPSFRDVQERIRKLQKGDTKQPVRAVAVGADDDFDRAFDDILGDGKLP
ncbi:MAG TPA: tetratricopeptide repeat protein [Polyangiaceae bacterium]